MIQASRFLDNVAENAGAIYVSNHIMEIRDWNFDSNRATLGDGGGLYLEWANNYDCEYDVYNNTFTKNLANISGGAVAWNDIMPYNLSNNTYELNSALYGNDIASYPIRIEIIDNESRILEDNYVISNIPSGYPANFTI